MIPFIQKVDVIATNTLYFLFPHNPLFTYFFSFFSLKGNSLLIWATIVLFLILFEERHDKRFIFYFLASFGITAFLSNIILKNIFQRIRPYMLLGISMNTCPSDFSFPSGHAATAFAAAMILSAFDAKRKWFYFGIALLISFSRIYLGCHYLIDIVVGALLGYGVSKCILFLKERIR